MKTQEEIDEVYKKLYLSLDDSPHHHTWVRGYTQCQQDMADKKYTKEDIIKAIEIGVNAEAGDYPKGFSYKLGISLEDYFINSLNKQD